MKTKLVTLMKKLAVKFWYSVKRFPVSIAMAASAVAIFIVLNHLAPNASESLRELLKRIAFVLALGVPLFLSIKVFFERNPQVKSITKITINIAGLLILVIYFIFLLPKLNPVWEARYSIYTLFLYLLFLFIPMLFRGEGYELYAVKLFTGFVTVLLYSIILYAGISAVLGSTILLFKLKISSRIYADIASIVFGILAPVLFLSYVPAYGTKLHVENYPKVLRILFLNIILPILSVFSLIFYIYFLTILFKPWPGNIIFRIAFFFLLSSIVTVFFIYPLSSINKWAKTFVAFFPKLLLPFIILMFMSLIIRIRVYGFTFTRYFLVAAAIWITFSLIYLSFIKKSRNILLPISLAVLLFLSVTGPWNFSSVTNMSQNSKFNEILVKYDMLQEGKIVKSSKEISEEDKISLTSIIDYYRNNFSFKDLKYLPDNFTEDKIKDVFGFEPIYYYGYRSSEGDHYFYNLEEQNYILDVKDYDFMAALVYEDKAKTNISKGSLNISIDRGSISIKNNEKEIYSKSLSEIVKKINLKNGNKKGLTAEEMTIKDGNENLDVVYLFNNLDIAKDYNSDSIEIYNFNLNMLVKLKK